MLPGTLPGGWRVTRATASDIPAIVALLADDPLGSGREGAPDDPAYTEAFARIDADPHQCLVVIRPAEEDTVLATMQISLLAGLSRRGALRAQLEAVRVAAQCRGEGLGGEMFAWAISWCREQGAVLVQLTTDKTRPDARRFYERLGFVASHEGMKLPL